MLGDEEDGVNEAATSDEIVEETTASSDIQLLRGEESFTPDEASLQLVKDPVTGEMTFGQPALESEPVEKTPGPVEQRELDFINDDDFGAGIEATVELDEPYEEAQEAAGDVSEDSREIDLTDFDEDEKQ